MTKIKSLSLHSLSRAITQIAARPAPSRLAPQISCFFDQDKPRPVSLALPYRPPQTLPSARVSQAALIPSLSAADTRAPGSQGPHGEGPLNEADERATAPPPLAADTAPSFRQRGGCNFIQATLLFLKHLHFVSTGLELTFLSPCSEIL